MVKAGDKVVIVCGSEFYEESTVATVLNVYDDYTYLDFENNGNPKGSYNPNCGGHWFAEYGDFVLLGQKPNYLLAAAPELLEVVEMILDRNYNTPGGSFLTAEERLKAIAAINKAKGE